MDFFPLRAAVFITSLFRSEFLSPNIDYTTGSKARALSIVLMLLFLLQISGNKYRAKMLQHF